MPCGCGGRHQDGSCYGDTNFICYASILNKVVYGLNFNVMWMTPAQTLLKPMGDVKKKDF
jgi:hypothetical protein